MSHESTKDTKPYLRSLRERRVFVASDGDVMMKCFLLLFVLIAAPLLAQTPAAPPISYVVSFPEPEHQWVQVEVTWTGLGTEPLDAHMSRSSPGRYAVAEFAKNVFSVEAFDGKNRKLRFTRPDADVWRISGHDGTVRV